MVTSIHNDQKPEFAGDYILKEVIITNHIGKKVNVKNIMTELNIYESIFKSAVTGSIVLADSTNQIARMQIQGLERLSFHLKTPGVAYGREDVVDATEETGEPFHIYKITDRKQPTPGMTIYTLHFASREFMRNMRTKVSQSYDGKHDRAVIDIMKDPDYLDSRKKLYVEPTGNSSKIVVPNLSPFDAINMIARKSIADKSRGVGYYFYETTTGYYFRSWQNMITNQGQFARPYRQDFYYQPAKISDVADTKDEKTGEQQDKIAREYQSVEQYQFVNNFHDVAANTALGTYGHRVISHNLFDKSYDIADYNYHNEFGKTPHTDTLKYTTQYAIMNSPVDYDNKDNVSSYAESRVSLQTTSPFLHDKDVGRYGLDAAADGTNTGQKISQYNQIAHGTLLKLTVKGQSNLQAGDLIRFNLADTNADNNNNTNPNDPRFSGHYVITKVRHQVTGDKYTMILECAKDSVATPYGSTNNIDEFATNVHTTNRSLEIEEIDSDIGY